MQVILHHFYQHLAGDISFVVSLSPVFIEISQPVTFELAKLTVPGLDLVVDVTHVVPQSFHVEELQLTLSARLGLLPLGVVPSDVFQKIFIGC